MTKTNRAILPTESVLEIYFFILEEHPGSNVILSTCTGLPCSTDVLFSSVLHWRMSLSKLVTPQKKWSSLVDPRENFLTQAGTRMEFLDGSDPSQH